MSNKNINESIRDAWQKSLQNGETIRSIKQKEKAQLDSIVEDTRNNVLSHLAENDKGFYRPETSPHHKFRDGGYLRRQRLLEQEAIPGSTSTDAGLSQDVDEERRKREREKRQQEQEQQERRREEVAAKVASARSPRLGDDRLDPSQRNPDEVRNPGRDQAIDNILNRTKDETPISVPDSLARPEDQSPRDPLADTMIGKPEEKTPGEFVLRPDEKKPEEVETVGNYRRNQLNKMSDEELAAEVDTQAKTDFGTKMDKMKADRAEKEGISVDEYNARTKKRQGKMREYDTDKELGRKRREEIKALELKAKAARRAGKREESIELYAQMQKLRRNTAADRREYARAGEGNPDAATATAAGGDDGDSATDTSTNITSDEGSISSDNEMDGINTGTVTDTAKDGEDNPNVQRVENPDGTVSVQTTNQLKGDVQDPTEAGQVTGSLIDDDGNVRDIINPTETEQDMRKDGHGIEGQVRKEVPLSNIFPNSSTEFEGKTIKGAPQSYRKKDGSGYVELSVDPKDPSGVRYIRKYQDGKQEVRYASGRVTTLDAQGNAIQAGEAGAAPELSNLQSRKIDSELANNSEIQKLRDEVESWGKTSHGRPFNLKAQKRLDNAVEQMAERLGISADQIRAKFEAELGLPAKTEAEKLAAKPETKTDPVTGVEAPTELSATIGAPNPAASPPPPFTGQEMEKNPEGGLRPRYPQSTLMANFNPINKYGINLFEAKGPLQR